MKSARDFAQLLLGTWYGHYGTAPCPVCQPERRQGQNALTVADGHNGGLLLHCKKNDCAFLDILGAVGLRTGDYTPPDAATVAERQREDKTKTEKRASEAKRLWQEACPIAGTLAETYLRARGITCDLPPALRFHPEAWHGPTARSYPSMVAAVQGAGLPAVHRTYLRADGSGKAAIDPDRMMLGRVSGGAVRLCDGASRLVVAEGIETGLSLLCGFLDTPATVWAGLSTSGLRGLHLPAQPGRLTIAVDGDVPGRAAGNALAERAHMLGWAVDLLDPGTAADFNDLLRKGVIA